MGRGWCVAPAARLRAKEARLRACAAAVGWGGLSCDQRRPWAGRPRGRHRWRCARAPDQWRRCRSRRQQPPVGSSALPATCQPLWAFGYLRGRVRAAAYMYTYIYLIPVYCCGLLESWINAKHVASMSPRAAIHHRKPNCISSPGPRAALSRLQRARLFFCHWLYGACVALRPTAHGL